MTLRYDPPGRKCLGKVQPGTDALRDWVLANFAGFSDLGIYNCRSVRGGSAPSVHGEGRAWDAGCTDQMRGDALAAWLVKNADPLCIQGVIWWERDWWVGQDWTPYDGASPHRDHLHIEQNWDGARNLTYAEIDRLVNEGDDMPRPTDVVAAIPFRGGKIQLQFDGGTRFVEGATWPHSGPFSYPGLPASARQGERGFYDILPGPKVDGFTLVATDGAMYAFPV